MNSLLKPGLKLSGLDQVLLVLVLIVNFLVLAHFYNRSWLPADDGLYAHVAERVLSGQVLNAQISESHPGYIHFVNAVSMKFFGRTLVSMRYTVAVITWIQSLLIFLLFLKQGRLHACAASFISASLGFVQISSPVSHLYTIFLTIVVACWLTWSSQHSRFRIQIVGILLASIFLFRQPSGVLVSIGVLVYLLLEAQNNEAIKKNTLLTKIIIGTMCVLISIYLVSTTNFSGFLLFGFWPLLILLYCLLKINTSSKYAFAIIRQLLFGIMVGLLPILVYHLSHGSLAVWFQQCFIDALRLTQLPHIKTMDYAFYVYGIILDFARPGVHSVLNGFYWLILVVGAFMEGSFLFCHIRKIQVGTRIIAEPLAVIACFFGLVSLYNQIPFYIYVTIGLSLIGALQLIEKDHRRFAIPAAIVLFVIASLGLYYHAGQPYTRPFWQMIQGKRMATAPNYNLKKSGVWSTEEENKAYTALIDLIRHETGPTESILVLPNNAEIYFLAERKNPFRFWNTAISIWDKKTLEDTLRSLAKYPPGLIIHNSQDPYNDLYTSMILNGVKNRYLLIRSIGKFDVYHLKNI